ncbi:MAG TPA: H-NS histone family protein [Hyphomicrobiaceae bacterium]|jgi:DNA-binding protein H-NS|nr:H-NS histone family protein [Hyphomicrobiaceae bacterium]
MARSNGRLSEKQVSAWFAELDFDKQSAILGSLHATHDSAKQARIDALRRQLSDLEGARARRAAGKGARKGRRRKGPAAVKYRDPKTGDTWSGRGRMARWLAAKVSAGEKADKYLA